MINVTAMWFGEGPLRKRSQVPHPRPPLLFRSISSSSLREDLGLGPAKPSLAYVVIESWSVSRGRSVYFRIRTEHDLLQEHRTGGGVWKTNLKVLNKGEDNNINTKEQNDYDSGCTWAHRKTLKNILFFLWIYMTFLPKYRIWCLMITLTDLAKCTKMRKGQT